MKNQCTKYEKTFNEKQVAVKIITDVFYVVNEMKLSIYRFLAWTPKVA